MHKTRTILFENKIDNSQLQFSLPSHSNAGSIPCDFIEATTHTYRMKCNTHTWIYAYDFCATVLFGWQNRCFYIAVCLPFMTVRHGMENGIWNENETVCNERHANENKNILFCLHCASMASILSSLVRTNHMNTHTWPNTHTLTQVAMLSRSLIARQIQVCDTAYMHTAHTLTHVCSACMCSHRLCVVAHMWAPSFLTRICIFQ